MSGDDGHTFTSARPMKAFRDYPVCEQEDAHAVGFIRNGRFGGAKSRQSVGGRWRSTKDCFIKCVLSLVLGQTH